MKKNKLLILLLLFSVLLLFGCKGKTIVISLDPSGGVVSETQITINKNEKITLPTPTKTDKSFIGWYLGNKKVSDDDIFESDAILIARWDKCDVKFLNDNGTTFEKTTIANGSIISFPTDSPTKEPDKDFCYYFDGWNIDDNYIVTSDLEVASLWASEKITWTTYQQGIDPLKRKMYRYSYIFKESLFDKPATIFNKDLALFAFGLSQATGEHEYVQRFYQSLNCDDIYIPSIYYEEPTENSIGYAFAHLKVKNSDIVFVVIRGTNYKKEWSNNFLIGRTGNHQGFYDSAQIVKNDLLSYLDKYKDSPSLKVLTTGYSRGGGVSNVLSHQLLTANSFITQDNLYTYTFEAPRGLKLDNGLNYPNVFNIINSADIVCHVAPIQYSMVRCGIDIDVYSSNLGKYLKDEEAFLVIPSFIPKVGSYKDEREFANFIIETLTSPTAKNPSLATRENFYQYYQDGICYFIGLINSVSGETMSKISNAFSNKSSAELLNLISGDNLFNFINPIIKQDGISYDEGQLRSACSTLSTLISGPGLGLAGALSDSSNLTRMLSMHYPQVTYVLLLNLNY